MVKKIVVIACVALAFALILTAANAAEKQSTGEKARNFWQKLFNYPARVTDESATVVADTGKRGTTVVTKEVRRVGQVTSGELGKTKELVMEPLTGTAETTVKAVEGTVSAPVVAAQEELNTEAKK